jgi:hypothetical protein
MVERLRDSGGEGGHGIGEAKGSLLAMVVGAATSVTTVGESQAEVLLQ